MDGLWHRLIGSFCVLCRAPLPRPDAGRQICGYCLAALPWLESPDIRPVNPAIERIIAPLAYRGDPRRWVLAAKREQGLIAARVLGELLAQALLEAYPVPAERPTRLIPVPLSARRLRARGHNQAALIAAPVARRLRIRLDRTAARRIRHTPIQPGMDPAARSDNMRGAFRCRRLLNGERVAILDDVLTTGATVSELANVLEAAGAGAVHVWSATAAEHPR